MTSPRIFPVPDALVGERVDAALARMLGLSRSRCAELAGGGTVLINGVVCGKSDRLSANDMIEVTIPEPEKKPTPVTDMAILYEDEDIVVVDKPVGVAAHTGPGWQGPTVLSNLEAAGYRITSYGPPERQGIVHRLDVGTSGAMMVAKSELAYTVMKRAFKERTIEKVYHAVVAGHLDPTSGTIDAPIARHPSREWRMAVIDGGKRAVTHYDTVELMALAQLTEIHLETGRTHQIRVHMAAVGHPCVGDTFYGADPTQAKRLGLTRQWLHAVRLGFAHPRTGMPMSVSSPYPGDLQAALEELRHPRADPLTKGRARMGPAAKR